MLTELPALAAVLGQLTAADAALLDAVAGLTDLLDHDEVAAVTGVGIEHWLAAVAAQTRMDRRTLMRACRLMRRLPTLDAAVRDHRISFAQLRGLTIGLRTARTELDGQLDALLAALLDELERLDRPEPDVLVRQMVDALDELDAHDLAERDREATTGRFLALQPRLDGTGGRLIAELDAAGTALLDAVTAPSTADVAASGGYGAARLDLLLARLVGVGEGSPTTAATATTPQGADLPASPPPGSTTASGHRDPDLGWRDLLPAPRLLVRLPFDALLDDRIPADLLTRLSGGRLRLTASAARRLADRAGAHVRAIVVDEEGAVIGVGRASRQPPGWLSDAIAAIHDTCTGPGCDRPARGSQTDHAQPWWPTRPDIAAGTTDIDNLGPLCATTNRAKESTGWQVRQRRSGTRTWVHPRSGLTTTTVPATWRAAQDPRRRRPPSSEPPGATRAGSDSPGSTTTGAVDDGGARDDLPF